MKGLIGPMRPWFRRLLFDRLGHGHATARPRLGHGKASFGQKVGMGQKILKKLSKWNYVYWKILEDPAVSFLVYLEAPTQTNVLNLQIVAKNDGWPPVVPITKSYVASQIAPNERLQAGVKITLSTLFQELTDPTMWTAKTYSKPLHTSGGMP